MCFPRVQWKRVTVRFSRTECGKGCQRQQEGFCRYIGDKKKAKENVGSLLKKLVDLVTQDMRY